MTEPITFTPRGRDYYSPAGYDEEGAQCQAAPLRKLSDAERAALVRAQDVAIEPDFLGNALVGTVAGGALGVAGALAEGAGAAATAVAGATDAGVHVAVEAFHTAAEYFADLAHGRGTK